LPALISAWSGTSDINDLVINASTRRHGFSRPRASWLKMGSLSNRALLVNNLIDLASVSSAYRHVSQIGPAAVFYFSPWLLCRFDLVVRAISIRRRIASGRPGLSG
jgi:hypothetical protein